MSKITVNLNFTVIFSTKKNHIFQKYITTEGEDKVTIIFMDTFFKEELDRLRQEAIHLD